MRFRIYKGNVRLPRFIGDWLVKVTSKDLQACNLKTLFTISTIGIAFFYAYSRDLFITLPLVLINISFILVSMLRDR